MIVDICTCGHESYNHHKSKKACGVTWCKCRRFVYQTSEAA